MRKKNKKLVIMWFIFNVFIILIMSYYTTKTSADYLEQISYKSRFIQRVDNLSVSNIKDREYLVHFLKICTKDLRKNNILFLSLILLLLLYFILHIYIINKMIKRKKLKRNLFFLFSSFLFFIFWFFDLIDVLSKTYISDQFLQDIFNKNKQKFALAKQYALLYYDQMNWLTLKYLLLIFVSTIVIIIFIYINFKNDKINEKLPQGGLS